MISNSMDWKILSSHFSDYFFLLFIAGIPLIAFCRGIKVYESFVLGAKEGFDVAIKIIPYLIAILVAVGMFRAAGGFSLLGQALGPLLHRLGFPIELLPLALTRPFSGSASNALLADLAHSFGGDSFLAHAGAILMGSTETTLYVLAVYFGAASITRTRYALRVGLFADGVGVVMAIVVTHWFF
jgi:spore maturation protein B